MKKGKKKIKSYANGTGRQGIVRNYIESPDTALYENMIDMAEADHEANTNPWVQGLNLVGNAAIQYGGSMNPIAGQIGGGLKTGLAVSNQFGYGGQVPVEVEGKEVAETPEGMLMEFMGNSHENGGINLNLPEGTDIFSKRIKVKGVSMADRKKKRERKELTLKNLLEDNPTDAINKNTLNRTKTVNEKEENSDEQIQQLINALMSIGSGKNQERESHAFGDRVGKDRRRPGYEKWLMEQTGMQDYDFKNHRMAGGGYNYDEFLSGVAQPNYEDWTSIWNESEAGQNGIEPTEDMYNDLFSEDFMSKDLSLDAYKGEKKGDRGEMGAGMFGSMTGGDWVGLAGNMISTFGPMLNTQKNRAGDTPNINYFEDFGNDSLDVLDELKTYIDDQKDNALMDLETARTGNVKRNRNTARGVNTMRALDIASSAQANQAQGNIYDMFSKQMMNILGQEAGFENQQDQMVMSGEREKDLADRQDRDNFFTQRGQDIATMGQGIQETGKDLNSIKQNQVIQNLLNQLSKYGITIDNSGKLGTK